MSASRNRQRKWNYLALAFAFPFVGMLVVMIISGHAPFGESSILYSDMYHQYYPFFVAFREALRSGDSLLHSWNVGLGMDYLGLISYYLASPLNLISVLLPESWLLGYFSLMMPLKLGLAGLFFGIFLKKLFAADDLSISLFGSCYALCAWALGYQWNIMWLDTFALLPLVVLGAVSLLRDKRYLLYTLTLALAVFSNYYIGFFVCLFIFLLFFVYEICRWQGWRRFFGDLLRIACFSLLAIGLTAILELPAFAALQTTQSSVNTFPQGFKLNIADENTWKGLLDAMRQVAGNMGGGVVPTFKEGLPNLYCGVGTVLLVFLYFTAKDVPLRDKLCAGGMLIFFMLSFIIRQLDYIWHGFHFTNMIPYRFSFLFSFVMLYLAYRAWTLRHSFKLWQVLVGTGLSLGIFACSDLIWEFNSEDNVSLIYIAYNLIFLLFYAVTLILAVSKKKDTTTAWKDARQLLAAALAAELAMTLLNFGLNFTGTNISFYPRGKEYTASVIRYMHEREDDTLFYRAETAHSQTLNDGALNGYNGVSTFTSSANVKVTEFMQALGYGAKNTYNRYCYEEASPVSNLFLNLKYMIERNGKDKESSCFTAINTFGDTALLENNYYLPLGFLAEPELAQVVFEPNGFYFQNELISAASGLDGGVWMILSDPMISGNDVQITDQNSSGYCAYANGLKNSTITYTYTVTAEGFMCVDLNLPKRNNVSICKNGVELYSETMTLQQMLAVGDVVPGDVVEIRCSCKTANESGTITISAAIMDLYRFQTSWEVLAASTLELTTFENTLVEGTIHCNRDGLLYTSIPQNGNWSVQVDGQDAQITLIGEAMAGVMLTEGSHTVTFTYHNAAFSLGWKITLLCALILAALYVTDRKKNRHPGKFQRDTQS